MNQLQTFNQPIFGELPVLIVNGEEWFGAVEAAKALSFSNPRAAIINHVEEEDVMVHDTPTTSGVQQKKFVNESGLYSLIFGAAKQGNNPEIRERAKQFKRWVTREVLPSIRKTGSYSLPSSGRKESFEMQLIGVEYTARILRVDETSKIKMLEAAHKQFNVPITHLPAYVDEEVTKSLSVLLKEHGIKIATAKVNTKLIEFGILEIKERPSSKGGTKEFKSLTEKGLYFGKNLISPQNPKETLPHYFPSKFPVLLELIELKGVCNK